MIKILIRFKRNQSRIGFTVIELLIAMAIVGILAAIAVPMYTGYLERARRAAAKTALEQLRAAQEMRRAERGSYSTNLTELRTTWGVQSNPVGYYNLVWVGDPTPTTWTAEAQPFGSQTSDGSLRIDYLGNKTPADKWAR
jgi:type IV pilus assembly protein PilE